MSIEKIHEKALHIGSISDLKRELKVDLTQKEEASLEKDFKPFELAESKAEEVQKKIEEQSEQKLKTLKELVSTSKEIKGVAMEKQTGLIGEIEGKVNDTAEQIQKKAQSALSPFEKMRENIENTTKDIAEKITSAWEKIITPIKFGWYSIWAYFGLKYGKEGLAELAKEKVDTVTEDLKKKSEKNEQIGEDTPETSGPLGVLEKIGIGIMGTSAFATIKGALPDTGEGKGKSMMQNLGKNRALKLFGFSGLTLFGLGQLSTAVEDPEIQKQVGDMPMDPEEKKAWFIRVIEASKNIAGNTKESLKKLISAGWDTASGERLDQHFSKHETREGYVRLDEHPIYTDARKELSGVSIGLEKMYYQQRAFFDTVLAGSAVASKGALIGTALKGPVIVMKVLGLLAPKFLIPAAIVGAIGGNSLAMIRNIEVPENMSEEDLRDLISIPSISNSIRSHIPDFDAVNIDLKPVANNLDKFGEEIKNWHAKTFLEKMTGTVKEWLIQDEKEMINKKNITGLAYFRIALKEIEHKESSPGKYDTIIHILEKNEEKMNSEEVLTEADIRELMEATRGSDISIFPIQGDKAGKTLQWVRMRDGYEVNFPVNICVNPTLNLSEQAKIAEGMVIEAKEPDLKDAIGGLGIGLRKQISLLGEAINLKKIKEASGIIDTLIAGGCGMVKFGYTVGIEYLGNLFPIPFDGEDSIWTDIFSSLTGEMTGQEFLIEYGKSIAPAFVIYGIRNRFSVKNRSFLGWKLLADTAIAPLKTGKMMWEGGRKSTEIGALIYDRYKQGDIAGILRDPLVRIKSGTIGHIQEKIGHSFRRLEIGRHIQEIGELNKLRAMLLQVKEMRDLRPHDTEVGKEELKRIQEYIVGPEKRELRERLNIKPGDTIHSVTEIDLHTLDEIIQRVEASQMALSNAGRKIQLETEKTKKTVEIAKLEAEMNGHSPGHPEYESRKLQVTNLRTELEGIEKGLKGLKNLHIAGKAGKAGALLGAIGGMAYVHGKAVDYFYGKSSEFDKNMPPEELDFYGFEKDQKTKEFMPERCDSPEEFNEKIIEIESKYQAPFEHLLDPKWIKHTSQSDIKGYILGIQKLHREQVENVQKMVKENRGMMEKYWEEKGANKEVGEEVIPETLRAQSLSAFIFIHKTGGQFRMEYMSEDDIKSLCYEVIDNGWYARNISENTAIQKAAQAGETGLRLLPISGTIMDAKDAYQSFYRGNIGEGFANLGWCALGLGLDVFSAGTAGTLSRATRIGINIGQNVVQTGLGVAQGIITTAHRSESIELSRL